MTLFTFQTTHINLEFWTCQIAFKPLKPTNDDNKETKYMITTMSVRL